MRLRLLLGLCVAAGIGAWAATAAADPVVHPLCPTVGTAVSGTYRNLTITGNRYVDSGQTLTVQGNLTIAQGACLDAFSMSTVTVGQNILVGKGAILALGCTVTSLPPGVPTPCTGKTTDFVGGNIVANQPLTMYLDGDTINGNVTSNGGGPGLYGPFKNFPIKDNTIGGNLHVQGWQGGWAGVIRNVVGGNVVYSNNMSVQDPDANEVMTNIISGNLICQGNSPAAQVNPADGGQPNTVGGKKIGQCAGL